MHSQVNRHLKTSSALYWLVIKTWAFQDSGQAPAQNESHQLAVHLDSLLRHIDAPQIQIEAVWLCFILRMDKATGSNIELKWEPDYVRTLSGLPKPAPIGLLPIFFITYLISLWHFCLKNIG